MKKVFETRESGTSLVELIMAVGILGIIGAGAATFFKRMQTAEYEARAKTSAISEISLFLNSIERDLKLRDINDPKTKEKICGTTKCKSFTFERPVKVGISELKMTVSVDTLCAAIPGSTTTKFIDPTSGTKFDFNNAGEVTDSAAPGECFRLAGCKGNTYPQVNVVLQAPSGASLPIYPRISGNTARFPNLQTSTSASSTVTAAAACAESKIISGSIGGSDRIKIEAAFINAQGKLRVEKREISIPRNNVAKIQILPAN